MSASLKPVVAIGSEPPREPQLPVLRFGLRQMFWLLTLCGLVLAAVLAAPVPGMAPAAVLLGVLVVVFHVVGTALGSRLREHADEQVAWESTFRRANERADAAPILAAGPRSSWHERGRPVRWRWRLVAAGAVVGGSIGLAIFLTFERLDPSPAEVACGALSLAVLGGWFAFLASHFWSVFRRGWLEAIANEQREGPRVS